MSLAFELGWSAWKLAFATAPGDAPRRRRIAARHTGVLLQELAKAKQRFGLAADAPVCCCSEAGRDGFWLPRWLTAQGCVNRIVDSASIEVNRRKRRAKSDRRDAAKLVRMWLRHHGGEKVWSVVHVPSGAAEDRRQLHRDLLELQGERPPHVNRLKGLLAGCGLAVPTSGDDFVEVREGRRPWDGTPVPAGWQQRRRREFARHQFVQRQIQDVENERARTIRTATDEPTRKVPKLLNVRGLGAPRAWLFTMAFFGWRGIQNRKQLAALAGRTPTPSASGDRDREQGIRKAGNRRLRTRAVAIAWSWRHSQPQSALSPWYVRRWGSGSRRQRRIGIVALARKLLVAWWRYLATDPVPAGAATLAWQVKRAGRKRAAVAGV